MLEVGSKLELDIKDVLEYITNNDSSGLNLELNLENADSISSYDQR